MDCLSLISTSLTAFRRSAGFLRELGDAARDVGFFYLVGHRIDEMLIDSIVVATRPLFHAARA